MLTVPEAARRAGRNPETIRRWIREGKLTAWKVGMQHVIDVDDLTNALHAGKRRGRESGAFDDPATRSIVSALHQARADRATQLAETAEAYVPEALRATGPQWDDRLPQIVGRIVRAVDPVRVVLFGSRARADARPDSDYDLLVLLDDVKDPRAMRLEIRRALDDLPISKDVLVAPLAAVDDADEASWSGVSWALAEGRTIYARQGEPD
jgi:excisionase family DNA binding protein